jgi:hypothetical protein
VVCDRVEGAVSVLVSDVGEGSIVVGARLREGMVYRLTADTAETRRRQIQAARLQAQLVTGPSGNLRL